MRDLDEDTIRFLEWIDKQIVLTLRHNTKTVMTKCCCIKEEVWTNNIQLEDLICYEIVEAFHVMDKLSVLHRFEIYWDTMPSDKELCKLLLEIPVSFIAMMIQLTKYYK